MFKVIYAIDTLDTKPEVTFFDTESEAYDYITEEVERRVSLQAKHCSDDLNSLREAELSLVHVEDWRE